jgi:hypothetical protein
MATPVLIKHKESGLVKTGCYGFSWTYLFFGFLVPMFRGEVGIAVLHAILSFMTFGLWWIVCVFIYNKQYMTRMLTSGWVLADTEKNNEKAARALGVVLP